MIWIFLFQTRSLRFQFEDLPKLMEFYQIWAHELFPRLSFDAFIDRAEKVCSERRVKVHLEQWRLDRLRKAEDPEYQEGELTASGNKEAGLLCLMRVCPM